MFKASEVTDDMLLGTDVSSFLSVASPYDRLLIMLLPLFIWCQVDLLRGQKSDRVDVTLAPEELELVDNVLPAKKQEKKRRYVVRRRISATWLPRTRIKGNGRCRKKVGKSKKKDFKF